MCIRLREKSYGDVFEFKIFIIIIMISILITIKITYGSPFIYMFYFFGVVWKGCDGELSRETVVVIVKFPRKT